ncbi:MAG: hypothetical protein U9N84_09485 [Actinomycetota bacterium]|nr:hypothetical protein [Actinomycetota bacterium]
MNSMRTLAFALALILVAGACGDGAPAAEPAPSEDLREPVTVSSSAVPSTSDESSSTATTGSALAVEPPETTSPAESTAGGSSAGDTPEKTHPPDTSMPVTGEVPEEIMAAIFADLTARSGATLGEITVIRAEEAIWPDGSLGCAEPGATYTQEPVPGYWVVLEHAGSSYDYRASASGFFRLCTGIAPPSNPTG